MYSLASNLLKQCHSQTHQTNSRWLNEIHILVICRLYPTPGVLRNHRCAYISNCGLFQICSFCRTHTILRLFCVLSLPWWSGVTAGSLSLEHFPVTDALSKLCPDEIRLEAGLAGVWNTATLGECRVITGPCLLELRVDSKGRFWDRCLWFALMRWKGWYKSCEKVICGNI